MKNGYYVSHGLRSVKEDISRMCREAIKYGFLFLSGWFLLVHDYANNSSNLFFCKLWISYFFFIELLLAKQYAE